MSRIAFSIFCLWRLGLTAPDILWDTFIFEKALHLGRNHQKYKLTRTSDDIEEPCIGRCFHWSEDGAEPGGTVEQYREERVRGEVIRVRHEVQEKILYVPTAHLITGVKA